mmetsp:Transcript_15712/g.19907  ORF Transcript_15712/g.19907 Transcript_15712/m.19907 type:complete len:249 (+) Transcript_15712:240-986(+)
MLPPRLRRRSALPPRAARTRHPGTGIFAHGRRLRGGVQGVQRGPRARYLPCHFADGAGAHLWLCHARGQGGPHGGTIRQAALGAGRGARWRVSALLPRRHCQQRGVHPRRAAQPALQHGGGLPPELSDHQHPARLCPRRIRRHQPPPRVEPGLCGEHAGGLPLPPVRHQSGRVPALHEGHRRQHRQSAVHRDRLLHRPRVPPPPLRAGAHPRGLHHRQVLRLLRSHALGRGAHQGARRRSPRVRQGHW